VKHKLALKVSNSCKSQEALWKRTISTLMLNSCTFSLLTLKISTLAVTWRWSVSGYSTSTLVLKLTYQERWN